MDKKTLEQITKLRSTNYKLKLDNNLKVYFKIFTTFLPMISYFNCLFQETFLQLIKELKTCMEDFNIGLRILHVLVADLPNSPLGTQVIKFY